MAITFEETTDIAGVDFAGISYGAAWGDFNGDTYPDLWANNHFNANHNLYLNQGNGTFTEISTEVLIAEDLQADFHGSAWADFDNDSDQDLVQLVGGEGGGTFLPPRSEPNLVFVNDGGLLTNQAETLGLAYDSARAQSAILFDFDNDGLLDLFHGATTRPDGLTPPTLFRQTGNGFEDVGSTQLPSEIQSRTITYSILSDLSGNGTLDLFLPQADAILDTTSTPFNNITPLLLASGNFPNARDVAAADFNNDLRPDLYLARGGNDRLFLNSDQGLINSSNAAGINNSENSDAQRVVAGDLDNDMDVDIYIVRNEINIGNLPNLLYENQGDGTFIAVPDAGGAAGSSLGQGETVVTADYDLDGFLDLFVTNGFGDVSDGPHQLFNNQGNNNNWLQIDLEGMESNRDGIGAQIFLTSGGVTQLREQGGGFHRWSQDSQRIHFGLAENSQVDLLEIRWPSGAVQQLENIPANQLLTIIEEDNANGTPGQNTPPQALDDSATTQQNQAIDINVLNNDTDADGDSLSLSINTVPSNGTAVIDDNGTGNNFNDDFITYTPDTNFTGNDQFTYEVDDGNGGTDIATVTVTVNAPGGNTDPVATNDTASTDLETPVDINVLANDSDADGDPLTLSIAIDPTNGTAIVDDNGTAADPSDDFITYTPTAGFTGTDSLTYQIDDGNGGTDMATVTVTVNTTAGGINGTNGNDTLNGTSGDDIINGLGGRDLIFGLDGNDTLNGNEGNDNLQGGFNDDSLNGSLGNDLLIGDLGNDILTGGDGSDRFRFTKTTQGVDEITDFAPSEDTIQFNDSTFGGGLVPGVIPSNQFVSGTTAVDSDDRFIYDQSTGDLFFDVDGNGNSAPILMARLSNQASLNSTNIVIF